MSAAVDYSKKPSVTTLRRDLVRAINAGHHLVELTWGENQITVERGPHGLFGHGWIGRHGGQDLAAELRMRS
jgi:hypothetical protein